MRVLWKWNDWNVFLSLLWGCWQWKSGLLSSIITNYPWLRVKCCCGIIFSFFQFPFIMTVHCLNIARYMCTYLTALSLYLLVFFFCVPSFLFRSSRGGSIQRCRQSTTLSGLSLSPWSSPVNRPLHLNLTRLHKDHRTPSKPPTPSGSVSTLPLKPLKLPTA